jgi:hypothetical protein
LAGRGKNRQSELRFSHSRCQQRREILTEMTPSLIVPLVLGSPTSKWQHQLAQVVIMTETCLTRELALY